MSSTGDYLTSNPDVALRLGSSLAPMFGIGGLQAPLRALSGLTEYGMQGSRDQAYKDALLKQLEAQKSGTPLDLLTLRQLQNVPRSGQQIFASTGEDVMNTVNDRRKQQQQQQAAMASRRNPLASPQSQVMRSGSGGVIPMGGPYTKPGYTATQTSSSGMTSPSLEQLAQALVARSRTSGF